MAYPPIDNPIDYDTAVRGALESRVIMNSLWTAHETADRMAVVDPSLYEALERHIVSLSHLMDSIRAVLYHRDLAVAKYAAAKAGEAK